MTDALVICTAWTPVEKNTLRGFADLYFTKMRMTIHGCMLHEKAGKKWVSFPSMPKQQPDGNVARNGEGKIVYKPPVISFDQDVRDRLTDAAVAAIEARSATPASPSHS